MKKFLLAFLLSISAVAQQGIFPGTGGGGTSSGVAVLPGTPNVVYTFVAGSDQTCTATTGKITDISGSGNNATQSATPPSCTGTGMNYANSTSSATNLPAALNNDLTFCSAMYFPPFTSATQNPTIPAFNLIMGSSNGQTTGLSWISTGGGTSSQQIQPFTFASGTKTVSNEGEYGYHVMCLLRGISGNSTTDRLFIDGVESTYISTGVSGASQTTGNFLFGANSPWYSTSTYYYFAGWAAQLTPAQIAQASNSITQTVAARGVQVLPTTVLTSNTAIDIAGDSIANGFGATSGWPSNMTLVGGYTIVNNSITSSNTFAMLDSARWRDQQYCYSYAWQNIVLLEDITNDATFSSAGGAFGRVQATAAALQRAGCRVGVVTMISRGGGFDAFKDSVNAFIRQGAGLNGYFVVDLASDSHMGCDGCNSNATYFNGDLTHPTQTGQLLLAAAASNAINAYGFGAASAANTTQYTGTVSMVSGDRFVTGTPTGAATYTLPDCIGVTGTSYQIFNNAATAQTITFAGKASEAIAGATTATQGQTAVFQATLISQAAGGCGWQRVQ